MTNPTVLLSSQTIAVRVEALAREVATALPREFVIVALLKGAFVLTADLVRALDRENCKPAVEFLRVSSYGMGQESSGRPNFTREATPAVQGRTVLLVDDIQDTGRTLAAVAQWLTECGAERVWSLALLDKPSRRVLPFQADFVGFVIDDLFVVGYGIDWAERYRHLPYIGHVQPSQVDSAQDEASP